ncbi:hypothetical protein O0L34_g14399 [Tuta absoluta]|nr:hypothetical protein O0L34_g14399 [Tuta absoluta]
MLTYRCCSVFHSNITKIHRSLSLSASYSKRKVFGIETSCDDTGCAVVDDSRNILGEAVYSQNALHVRYGGVNPIVAHELHRENIEPAARDALERANLTMSDVDAIAVTTRPGLLISLQVGVKFAKYLARTYKKPLIPIHHMQAHALVARMTHNIEFPFLVLLISGGDSLLAVVRDVDDFLLLGQTFDNAPGEVMDKAARRMKLRNMKEYSSLAGGAAIELAAKKSNNPDMFEFPTPLVRSRDCNFSFSGLKDSLVRKLQQKEKEHEIMGDGVIPEVFNLCAAFQVAIAEHLVQRTERAALYCEKHNLIPEGNRNLVISGGVSCNDFIFKSMQYLGQTIGYNVFRPPPKLCTDNGVMIAWNGIEKLRVNKDIVSYIDLRDIEPVAPLGKSLIDHVKSADLKIKLTRLKKFHNSMDIDS